MPAKGQPWGSPRSILCEACSQALWPRSQGGKPQWCPLGLYYTNCLEEKAVRSWVSLGAWRCPQDPPTRSRWRPCLPESALHPEALPGVSSLPCQLLLFSLQCRGLGATARALCSSRLRAVSRTSGLPSACPPLCLLPFLFIACLLCPSLSCLPWMSTYYLPDARHVLAT